jgi:hypothetical protein
MDIHSGLVLYYRVVFRCGLGFPLDINRRLAYGHLLGDCQWVAVYILNTGRQCIELNGMILPIIRPYNPQSAAITAEFVPLDPRELSHLGDKLSLVELTGAETVSVVGWGGLKIFIHQAGSSPASEGKPQIRG